MAFWKRRMVEVYATTNAEEKFRIQEQFAQHGIDYKMKVKDYSRSLGARMSMGGADVLGSQPIRMTTIFYVRDEDVEAALALIRRS